MTQWNLDITTAPKGRQITVTRKVKTTEGLVDREFTEHQPEHVWLASVCGKVIKSAWVPANDRHDGYWPGFAQKGGTPPIAWQPYVVPEHPHKVSVPHSTADLSSLAARESDESAASPFILDDVGGF